MRDIKALHPELQKKAAQLIKLCAFYGIKLAIGECVRTVAEQDKLYSYGRTDMSRGKCTNVKGSTYSSMHQWGVAFDIILLIDVDGDGQTKDDTYNDSKFTFEVVGALGEAIGLEWGGHWTSITDKPHFQLKQWGSTPAKLKKLYGTPDKFMATWAK